jgi:hypothetical protein
MRPNGRLCLQPVVRLISVGRLVAEHGEQRLAGRITCEKEVASHVAGVVWFPSCRRASQVASVARSAVSPARVAAQQAHARDRRHDGC